jgi:hypothetical protein
MGFRPVYGCRERGLQERSVREERAAPQATLFCGNSNSISEGFLDLGKKTWQFFLTVGGGEDYMIDHVINHLIVV